MCGSADWKIDDAEFSIHIGYRYNQIRVNKSAYLIGDIKERYDDENPDEEIIDCDRGEMFNILMSFTKPQLIDMVLGFVDTGKEA